MPVRHKPERGRRAARRFGLLLILAGAALPLLALRSRLDPLVREMAVASARNAVNAAVQAAVAAQMAADDGYDRLVRLEKDESGFVTAAVTDMRRLNELRAGLTEDILRRLAEPETADLGIPLGNLTGSPLLSGVGPCVPVRILSVSEPETKLASRFTHAGINQTLHRLLLEIRTEVRVLIPGGTVTVTVYSDVTAAETVIVGQVPESYMYFESDDNWDEPLEQYDILS